MFKEIIYGIVQNYIDTVALLDIGFYITAVICLVGLLILVYNVFFWEVK